MEKIILYIFKNVIECIITNRFLQEADEYTTVNCLLLHENNSNGKPQPKSKPLQSSVMLCHAAPGPAAAN